MLHCCRHDLTFCSKHLGHCLDDSCALGQNCNALFCSVCGGVVREKPQALVLLNRLIDETTADPTSIEFAKYTQLLAIRDEMKNDHLKALGAKHAADAQTSGEKEDESPDRLGD